MKRLIALTILSLCVSATANAQTRALTDIDKKAIANDYGKRLKDPASAQYQWAPVPIESITKGPKVAYCFQVNAKNSYGGYVGSRLIIGALLVNGGRVRGFEYSAGANDTTPALQQATAEMCQILGYAF
jgi:hypothetical protein